MTTKICKNCQENFQIHSEDQAFYKRLHVSEPGNCPDCRQQRRLAWRNERTFYSRSCDLCKKRLLSIYPEDVQFPVYCNECWWSDKWNPMSFGQNIDLQKNLLTQYQELRNKVPRLAVYLKNTENCDYCNHVESSKNSYQAVDVMKGENIYYSKWIINCKDLADCYQLEKSELCYESQYSVGPYGCTYVFLSDNSRNSSFLYDCHSCNNCFLCWNLRHKQYCIENKQYSKQEYETIMGKIDLGSYKVFEEYKKKYFEIFHTKAIKKAQNTLFSENCSDCDFVYHSKNVHNSFDFIEGEDCRYCYDSGYMKDSYDSYESAFDCELQYDSHACNRGKRMISGHVSYDVDSVFYVDSCHNSHDLFACIGLKHKQYCILNKQYSKEEYQKLTSQLISHMEKNGTWGEFFPIFLSPYCYNESVAQEFFPLKKEQALAKGYRWKEKDQKEYRKATYELPDNIRETPESIPNEILACSNCGKNYRIAAPEYKFYNIMKLPIPRKCPFCRHIDRLNLRNPRKLLSNNCKKCGLEIKTAYSKNFPDIVYCEKCYMEAVNQ